MKTVPIQITLPEGWELAYHYVRTPAKGEHYLRPSGDVRIADRNFEAAAFPILRRVCHPVKGKVYKFWGRDEGDCRYAVFDRILENINYHYLDTDDVAWPYCAPIPQEDIGD
jgi:hypothetical protein